MNTRYRSFSRPMFLCLGMFALLCAVVSAQPVLNFKRIVNNWPTIELYANASCSGTLTLVADKQRYVVEEDGRQVNSFTVVCPDTAARSPFSVGLVLDASGSMQGASNRYAKAAGNAFIDRMDGNFDEATVIWFSSLVTPYQGMTNAKSLLRNAVNALPASGATAMWDGIYKGIEETAYNGINPCRGVIVLSDGADGSSTRTPEEIIALANRNRIRVFAVGLGASVPSASLQAVADLTGGRYYETADSVGLTSIFTEIATIFARCFDECRLSYEASCMDGSLRMVSLELRDVCNGSDLKSKTYRAPRDTTTFTQLAFRIGTATTLANASVTVPLELLTPLEGVWLQPFTIYLRFDTTCLRLTSIESPAGTPLEAVMRSVSVRPDGVRIRVAEASHWFVASTPFKVLNFVFMALNPAVGQLTIRCPIDCAPWSFDAGCFSTSTTGGSIEIILDPCAIRDPVPALGPVFDPASPNPFTDRTVIPFRITDATHVEIDIVNALGMRIERLASGMRAAGTDRVVWNGRDMRGFAAPPGVYFCRMTTRSRSGTMMTVVRSIVKVKE